MELTVADAARLLGVPEKSIYRWIKERAIPVHRINEQLRFHRSELLEWATGRQMQISPDIFAQHATGYAALPKLSDALRTGGVAYGIAGADKPSVLRAVVERLPLPEEADRDFLFSVLLAREELGSTGIGDGIAIPHVRSPIVLHVAQPTITLCFLAQPIHFGAIDDQPVHTLFTLVTPSVPVHLHYLSRLASVLRDSSFRQALGRKAPFEDLMAALARAESDLAPHNGNGSNGNGSNGNGHGSGSNGNGGGNGSNGSGSGNGSNGSGSGQVGSKRGTRTRWWARETIAQGA